MDILFFIFAILAGAAIIGGLIGLLISRLYPKGERWLSVVCSVLPALALGVVIMICMLFHAISLSA